MTSLESSFRSRLTGILLVILAFFCVAVMNALAKGALHFASVGTVLFMQNLWGLFCIIPFALPQFKKFTVNYWKLHLLRAFSGLFSYLCLFTAVQYISLVNATLLGNSAPLFLPFVVWIWLRQKIHFFLGFSLMIGFMGVIFIVHPIGGIDNFFNSWMVLVALLGSLFSAIALQSVRALSVKETSFTITFYYLLISTFVLTPFTDWKIFPIDQWVFFACIGVSFILSQLFLAIAYKHASPTTLGPFNYTVVISAGFIDWFFWNAIPNFFSILGIIFIILGGILSLRQQKPF